MSKVRLVPVLETRGRRGGERKRTHNKEAWRSDWGSNTREWVVWRHARMAAAEVV